MTLKHLLFTYIVLFGFTFSYSQEKDAAFILKKAISVGKKNNFREAANVCKEGLKKFPKNIDLQEYLGKSYLELGKLDSARYILKKVVDTYKERENGLRYLINVEYSSKRYSSAICYINELLEIQPYDKALWLKKVNIYKEMGNTNEALRNIKRLQIIYPNDKKILNTYTYITNESTHKSLTKGKRLNQQNTSDINSKDAALSMIKVALETHNKEHALFLTEDALKKTPNDMDLIKKKIGILDDLKRYTEALQFIEQSKKRTELTELYRYILQKATNYYTYQDVYELQKKNYTVSESKEDLISIIKTAIGRSYYDEANYYTGIALKQYPNDKQLLSYQLLLHKRLANQKAHNQLLSKIQKQYPNDSDIQTKYNRLAYERGKSLLMNKEYLSALQEFEYLSHTIDYKIPALQNLLAIYDITNENEKTLNVIDTLLHIDPNKRLKYLSKKSALYKKTKAYEKALSIAKLVYETSAQQNLYKRIFIDQSETYCAYLIKEKQYDKAVEVVTEAFTLETTLKLCNLAIDAAMGMKDYSSAITFAEKAMEIYPNQKNIRLKLSDAYLKKEKFENAIHVLENLHIDYPYDDTIAYALAISYYKKGKFFEKKQDYDQAITSYKKSIEFKSDANPAVKSLSNLYLDTKQPKKVIEFPNELDRANPDNNQLAFNKASAFDRLKKYDSAYYYLKQYNPKIKELKKWNTKLNRLNFKSLTNQFEFSYLSNVSDSDSFESEIGSIRYTKTNSKNSFFGEINHVNRRDEIGLQLHAGWYQTLSSKVYTRISYAISNKIFPTHRLSTSLFLNLKNDYELEFGAQFLFFENDTNISSTILGVSKIYNDFWFQGKIFLVNDTSDTIRNNVTLRSKYFISGLDYITLMAAVGNTPFDENLDFQNNSLFSIVNTMYGAGYYKQIYSKAILGLQVNWNSFEIEEDTFALQTNIFLVLKTRF